MRPQEFKEGDDVFIGALKFNNCTKKRLEETVTEHLAFKCVCVWCKKLPATGNVVSLLESPTSSNLPHLPTHHCPASQVKQAYKLSQQRYHLAMVPPPTLKAC